LTVGNLVEAQWKRKDTDNFLVTVWPNEVY
jgi:hypothetical protein